jgi:hypothetical protein
LGKSEPLESVDGYNRCSSYQTNSQTGSRFKRKYDINFDHNAFKERAKQPKVSGVCHDCKL